MSMHYYVPERVLPSTVVEAQPCPFNTDCHDVSLTMLKPPNGLEDPIQYHQTAVRYVLQCYGPLMCEEDRALLEKVVGSPPATQQTPEPYARHSDTDDPHSCPTNADVAANRACFHPYNPFPPFIWGEGEGHSDTTWRRNETDLAFSNPFFGTLAASVPFQDATNKMPNLEWSPMTAKADTENITFRIKHEDESYIVDSAPAEEPVFPDPVAKLATRGFNQPIAQTGNTNTVELPSSEHAPDSPSELLVNKTNESAIKRKREEDVESLANHTPSGPIRALQAPKIQGPVVVEGDSTPSQEKRISNEDNEVEVASTADSGAAPTPPKPMQPMSVRTMRMKTGVKPPKCPAQFTPSSPSPPSRNRKKTARMTTGGKPPKQPTMQGALPPPLKRQKLELSALLSLIPPL